MAGALSSIRVIDFGQYVAGPLAAMLLAVLFARHCNGAGLDNGRAEW